TAYPSPTSPNTNAMVSSIGDMRHGGIPAAAARRCAAQNAALAFQAPIHSLYASRIGGLMLRFLAVLAALLLLAIPQASATEAGWALLREGGQVVLLVHANAPGTGDPANFDLENCRTQRNLSERGRQQARKLGALIAARAEPVEKVYASR